MLLEQMLRERERREAEQVAAGKAEFDRLKEGVQVKDYCTDFYFESLKKDYAEKKQTGLVSAEEDVEYQTVVMTAEKWQNERRLGKSRFYRDWGRG